MFDSHSTETVEVVQVDGTIISYPDLHSRVEIVSVDDINHTVGIRYHELLHL